MLLLLLSPFSFLVVLFWCLPLRCVRFLFSFILLEVVSSWTSTTRTTGINNTNIHPHSLIPHARPTPQTTHTMTQTSTNSVMRDRCRSSYLVAKRTLRTAFLRSCAPASCAPRTASLRTHRMIPHPSLLFVWVACVVCSGFCSISCISSLFSLPLLHQHIH